MKLLTYLTIALALVTSMQTQSPTPSPILERLVKHELDEAARAYREGNFAEAQARSEKAMQLDPQNKTAPMYVARTIHAQYKPGDFTPENVAKAREAIIAYQRILQRFHGDDEAYKAVAYLYGAIKDYDRQREWIVERAGDVSLANDKRAEAFIVLASKDWDCSFAFTESPKIKVIIVKGNKEYVSYRMPKERVEFERAQACADHGMEMANMAITLAPENESAWAYKTNLFLELSKLAEMSGQVQRKRELLRQYEEALKETTRLSNRAPSNP